MKPEEIEKLLGGWATGTLSEAERKALLEAALTNQELFDALAEDEALRDLLSDARCRRQLLALLGVSKEPAYRRVLAWLGRPRSWALAGSLAGVILVASIVVQVHYRAPVRPVQKAVATADRAATMPRPPEAQPVAPLKAKQDRKAPARAVREERAPLRDQELAKAEQDKLAEAPPEQPAPASAAALEPAPAAAPEVAPPAERKEVAEVRSQRAAPAWQAPAAAPLRAEAEALDARALYYGPSPAAVAGFAEPAAPSHLRSKGAAEPGAARLRLAGARPVPVGLRYSVLKNGLEASPAESFQREDTLRLSVEANRAGYLYVWRQDTAGAWTLLFPSVGEQNRVEARARHTIPAAGGLPTIEPGGQQKLLIVFSQDPLPPRIDPWSYPEDGRKPVTQARGTAVYIVDPAPGPAARLRAEITLTCR